MLGTNKHYYYAKAFRKMGKKAQKDANRLFRILIYILFAVIVALFLFFAHRYYQFSRENGKSFSTGFLLIIKSVLSYFIEMLRADYQDFLKSARDMLASVKNSSVDAVNPRSAPLPVDTRARGFPAAPLSALPLRGQAAVSDGQASSDIVIGMAQNIDPKNFAVFCGSLRR